MKQVALALQVSVSKEVDGIEMGVLSDGTTYLTGRGLARLCGVSSSAIGTRAAEWNECKRDGKFAKLLYKLQMPRERLFMELEVAGVRTHAYYEDVCMAFLEYYAFESDKPSAVAQDNFRKLARLSLRAFIYQAVGYEPARVIPTQWRQFHDRIVLNKVPAGYFSVFREMSELVITAIQNGLTVDSHTVPDISIGMHWSKHWERMGMEGKYGAPRRYPHRYPEYFPQSKVTPMALLYPLSALPAFREWIETTYITEAFPAYLNGKVKSGALQATEARKILDVVDRSDEERPALRGGRRPMLPGL